MPAGERVEVVDKDDRVVGAATLADCLSRGLLHRAVAVAIARPDGRVILQQRSRRDAWHPGRWTLSCTGHVKEGETYAQAAARELLEELGIDAPLTPMRKYLLPTIRDGRLTENEWVTLFSATSDAKVDADPVELEGVKEFTSVELREMLEGEELTPDSVFLLSEYLRAGPSARNSGV